MPPDERRAQNLVREAVKELQGAGVMEAAASAEVLLSELLKIRRGEIAVYEEPLTEQQADLYATWISRRRDREPVQRILGYAYFRNLKLKLNEHTLIPRPDTESVVDAALAVVDRRGGSCRVLDIGTGSGAIAIAIAQERPNCEVLATDISEGALEIARCNAESNGATVDLHQSDIVSGLDISEEGVDLLISNPPYIASDQEERLAPEVRVWDPSVALFSGPDELTFYRRIFAETPPLLASGADVVLEIGDKQAEAVLELGRRSGFESLGIRPDLAGSPRAALLRWGR